MKGFRFRLQKVLDLHIMHEKTEAQALAQALAALLVAEQRREGLVRFQRDALGALEVALGRPGLEPEDLRRRHVELEACEEEIRRAGVRERDLKTRVRTCQDALHLRLKERKVMESLRDQARETHDVEDRRQEGVDMDEVASQLHSRRAGGRDAS